VIKNIVDLKGKRILITGSNGFLGSHLASILSTKDPEEIRTPSSKNCDLRIKENCANAVKDMDIVFHIAGVTGGIGFTKKHPGSVFYDNIMMGTNMLEESRKENIKKIISTGTVCSYPKFSPIPFNEVDIWNGYPEETNASYGLSKKMQIVQSQAYREEYGFNSVVLVVTNLYGPGDNFDLNTSHVIPSLITKISNAKKENKTEIELWGDGTPTRDFIHVEDAARAFVLAAEKYDKSIPINIGGGFEISIKDLADKILDIMDVKITIKWNTGYPNGQPRRVLDNSKAFHEFGFKPKIPFDDGLKEIINTFLKNQNSPY
jgi:GDP-L-fucose synthase